MSNLNLALSQQRGVVTAFRVRVRVFRRRANWRRRGFLCWDRDVDAVEAPVVTLLVETHPHHLVGGEIEQIPGVLC